MQTVPKGRARVTREEVIYLIEQHGGTEGLDLSYKDLTGVDLSGLNLSEINFSRSMMRGANFAYSKLAGADLSLSNCRGANFYRANLSRCRLHETYGRDANFVECSFYRAVLDGANFRGADLTRANLYKAKMTETQLSRELLGNGLVHDSEVDVQAYYRRFLSEAEYEKNIERHLNRRLRDAEDVYRALKILFTNTGQYSDASWAYIRERRFRRQTHVPRQAYRYYEHELKGRTRFRRLRLVWFYIRHLVIWVGDRLAEMSCGYGEKPLLTAFWAMVILLVFPILFALVGGIVHVDSTMTWIDYFNYSFGAFTTMGFDEFQAVTPLAQTLTSLEAAFGVSLLALLMFALGNRISRA